MKKLIPYFIITVCAAFIHTSVHAAEGGYSNYIPGFYGDIALATEPPTEFSMRNDVYSYSADTSRTVRGGQVELNADLTLTYDYLTFLHKPGIELLGAQFAYGAAFAVGKIELDADISLVPGPGSVAFSDSESGIGDITLIPFALYWNDEKLHYSFSNYVVVPVGEFENDQALNPSLNYWTIEFDFAMTYLNEETGQDYSLVLGYGYNAENDDTNYQSGDEVHIDYVVNQFLSEEWAIGLNGFYLKQISGDSGSGALLGDFKAEAAGIGPVVMWMPKSLGGNKAFIAKWLHEYDAENRLEGDHVFLSFGMSL
jgi:hypothetical protein